MTSPLSSIAPRSIEPRTVEIAVPGSTSNLGAGFDALGLALSVYLRLKATIHGDGDAAGGGEAGRSEAGSEPYVTFRFGGLTLDGENSIERALRAAAARYRTTLPRLTVDVSSDIPLKAGLGSSAAAIVAGIRLYEAIAGPLPVSEVLTLASDLEGHPDNTSASILGGLVTSCQADGHVLAVATPWPAAIRVVVATPRIGLDTKVARAALPDSVSRGDAIFNVQRAALFVQAIAAGRHDVLREALADRLHQPYRATLVPGLARALAFAHPQLLGVFLSGAGPSIAALTEGVVPEIDTLFHALYQELGLACTVRALDVHQP
jgi:homoserine kinase